MIQGGLGAIPPQDIECIANEGYVIVDQIWDCSYGSIAECTEVRRDCSGCRSVGTLTRGMYRYQDHYLQSTFTGAGWDCRHKCTRLASLLGLSGTEKKISENFCPNTDDDDDDYEDESGKVVFC